MVSFLIKNMFQKLALLLSLYEEYIRNHIYEVRLHPLKVCTIKGCYPDLTHILTLLTSVNLGFQLQKY